MTTRRAADNGARKARRSPRRAPAPRDRQRDPERTKTRILDAATEEFSAHGFAGARVSEIAARAGVNQQLIAYYFGGKEGLYREIGRRWRAYEAQEIPDDLAFPEMITRYVRASADTRLGARLLAWEGLADPGADTGRAGVGKASVSRAGTGKAGVGEAGTGKAAAEAQERDVRLRHEVELIRERQRAGELDDRFDPAALLLITTSAANALVVYPQLARALFGTDASSPELVEHYAGQLAQLIARLGGSDASPPD